MSFADFYRKYEAEINKRPCVQTINLFWKKFNTQASKQLSQVWKNSPTLQPKNEMMEVVKINLDHCGSKEIEDRYLLKTAFWVARAILDGLEEDSTYVDLKEGMVSFNKKDSLEARFQLTKKKFSNLGPYLDGVKKYIDKHFDRCSVKQFFEKISCFIDCDFDPKKSPKNLTLENLPNLDPETLVNSISNSLGTALMLNK